MGQIGNCIAQIVDLIQFHFFELRRRLRGEERHYGLGLHLKLVLAGAVTTFLGIALVAVVVGVLSLFFVSHYVFRWRTAMNDYYMQHWPRLRHIEGASQRVQFIPTAPVMRVLPRNPNA